ncbi:SIMPL domain-containing protein [Ancylomarina longa]|nr:SIMPL domain-containing protein [Ancylomarina longa]
MKKISVILILISFYASSFAQSGMATLSVKGESKIFQMPDIMEISITISNKDMEYQGCIDQNLEQVNRLKKAMESARIKNMQLLDVGQRVNEERSYIGGKSVPNGYRANYQLMLKVPAESGVIYSSLQAMKQSEVVMNYNANYKLSPDLLKSVEKTLMEQAVADAVQKAQILAEASKCQLIRILQIKYGVADSPYSPIRYMGKNESLKTSSVAAESFTNPNPIALTDRVEIDYQIQSDK